MAATDHRLVSALPAALPVPPSDSPLPNALRARREYASSLPLLASARSLCAPTARRAHRRAIYVHICPQRSPMATQRPTFPRKAERAVERVAVMTRPQHSDRKRQVSFAGVNVLCFGDFWQLVPTGDASFMSSPKKSTGKPHADRTLTMFWRRALPEDEHNDHLQSWHGHSRVWELSQNLRSGEDEWFSEVLDQCRVGDLKEENYNFLHGLPTGAPITFWVSPEE